MVDVVLQGAWLMYCINKDESDESLPLPVFRRHVVNTIFLKYSKEDRLSSSPLEIQNIPSDFCYDDPKHYQVQSEHFRTSKRECFCFDNQKFDEVLNMPLLKNKARVRWEKKLDAAT